MRFGGKTSYCLQNTTNLNSVYNSWGVLYRNDKLALFQYKDRLSWYRDSHYNDKTVVRPSFLYNGNLYTCKIASIYWDGPNGPCWNIKTIFPGIGILIIKITLSHNRLYNENSYQLSSGKLLNRPMRSLVHLEVHGRIWWTIGSLYLSSSSQICDDVTFNLDNELIVLDDWDILHMSVSF